MSRLSVAAFDLTAGGPTALKILRAELGWRDLGRALARFAWRAATTDPFEALAAPPANPAERFTRHQLRPVLLLEQVLRRDLAADESTAATILERVVSETGARFIEWTVRPPSRARWEAMSAQAQQARVRAFMDRFMNAKAEPVDAPDVEIAFDVTFCHFVDLLRRLGRPELAPLFCKADSVYFGRPDAPIRLRRDSNLAQGDDRCTFRLTFPDDEPVVPAGGIEPDGESPSR